MLITIFSRHVRGAEFAKARISYRSLMRAYVVDAGAVCLWVEGKSLALPYGPTPAYQGEECRLVTDVNVMGAIEGDPRVLATIHAGDEVTVEAM